MRIHNTLRLSFQGRRARLPGLAGFTLIELLAVIGILLVLVALVFPAVKKVESAARKTTCLANLKSIGIAQTQYSADNDNWITPNRWNESPSSTVFWCQELAAYITGKDRAGWPQPATECKVFHCPRAKGPFPIDPVGYNSGYVEKCSYSQNIVLGGGKNAEAEGYPPMQKRTSVQKPSKMVLVAEGAAVNMASWSYEGGSASVARHGKENNLLFVDGHVESSAYPVTPEQGNKTYNWSIGNENN